MKKKILCLAMTVIMAAGVHTTAFAKDYQGADGWQVNFTGGKMGSNFKSSDVTDELANIQPGDSIELKVQLKNSDSTDTDWYMTNEVIQTLEDAQSSAEGGAYEYKLTYVGSDNAEKVLYDSTTVGGEGASKAGEGLKQIDNSTQDISTSEDLLPIIPERYTLPSVLKVRHRATVISSHSQSSA